ncbi:acyl-CoA thioesterase [Paenibacillus sp. y28]|uniref:acyl-CoA thioesterase n=1 Tax=Paenibacillus sp. y28 TaxID=3129110 RepID=UPI003018F8D3
MAKSNWYVHPLRVRYQETDQMGVVYHANYLNLFEIGRTELIRELGMTYRELEAAGLFLPVLEANVKFRQPAKYDDLILIHTRIADFSSVRIDFESQIRRWEGDTETKTRDLPPELLSPTAEPQGDLLVSGGTMHMWLNRDWKPARIDKAAPALLSLLKAAVTEEDEVDCNRGIPARPKKIL